MDYEYLRWQHSIYQKSEESFVLEMTLMIKKKKKKKLKTLEPGLFGVWVYLFLHYYWALGCACLFLLPLTVHLKQRFSKWDVASPGGSKQIRGGSMNASAKILHLLLH